ncbi:MAG: hypothetical protein IJC71_02750 [Clostridia bacterium]|nr:hypothetical protein [Clostridia bacterium]
MKKSLAMILAMMLLLSACNTSTDVEEEQQGDNTPAVEENNDAETPADDETDPAEDETEPEEDEWEEEDFAEIELPPIEPMKVNETTGITTWIADSIGAPANLFDHDQETQTGFTLNAGAFVIFSIPESAVVTSYQLVMSWDTASNPDYRPATWRLYGCSDEGWDETDPYVSEWVKLDDIAGDETITESNYEAFTFKISNNKTAYKYYKFELDEARGNRQAAFSELNLIYEGAKDPEYKSPDEIQALKMEKTYAEWYAKGYVDASTVTPTADIEWISGNEDFEGFGSWNLHDFNLDSKWCVNQKPCECVWKMPEPVAITGYQFVTGNDTASASGRNPVNWVLYGSTNGTDWNVVDEVNGYTGMHAANFLAYDFWLEETAPAYAYYKFVCSEYVSGNLMQLSSLNLLWDGNHEKPNRTQEERDAIMIKHGFKKYEAAVEVTPIEGIEWISGDEDFDGYGSDKLTDYDPATKWCVNELPCAAVWKMPEAIAITGYQLVTGDDTASNPGRNPIDWTLSGSTDGENWVVIDQKTGDNTLTKDNLLAFDFWLEAKAPAYTYFKFECPTAADGNLMQLSGLHLLTDGNYTTPAK